jgi:hypothetical protein
MGTSNGKKHIQNRVNKGTKEQNDILHSHARPLKIAFTHREK